jgi:hypothetical protein
MAAVKELPRVEPQASKREARERHPACGS